MPQRGTKYWPEFLMSVPSISQNSVLNVRVYSSHASKVPQSSYPWTGIETKGSAVVSVCSQMISETASSVPVEEVSVW